MKWLCVRIQEKNLKIFVNILENPYAKKTYFIFKDLKIPSDTILHVNKRHKLTLEQWKQCLQIYSKGKIFDKNKTNKTRYDGQTIKYVYTHNNSFIGLVIETLKNQDKMLTTIFMDNKNSLLNWVKQ